MQMNNKRGISLIVLVITIVVMIILAGAIILSLNNVGVINKASDGVELTNYATVKSLTQMVWAEAYANGAMTQQEFQDAVDKSLEVNKVDTSKYLLHVTTSGVTVKLLDKAWIKKGFTVVRGEQVIEIGDVVAYDETAEGTKTGLTATEWQVLGADEDGNLLLMSTADVATNYRLGYKSTTTDKSERLKECQSAWLNVAAELDGVCEAYGYGEGTVGKARSITLEDVNAVAGYDPDDAPYGEGKVYQYKNVVEYEYNGTTNPTYTSVVTGDTPIALTGNHNGFVYYDGKEFKIIRDLLTGTSGDVFAKLTSNYYSYSAGTSIDNAKAHQMLFGVSDAQYYYHLASSCVRAGADYVYYGIYAIGGGVLGTHTILRSDGSYRRTNPCGVRAVVALSSDIELTGSSESGWSY